MLCTVTQLIYIFFLEPFSSYKIWVNAFTWKHEGETSKILEFHTDVQGTDEFIIFTSIFFPCCFGIFV